MAKKTKTTKTTETKTTRSEAELEANLEAKLADAGLTREEFTTTLYAWLDDLGDDGRNKLFELVRVMHRGGPDAPAARAALQAITRDELDRLDAVIAEAEARAPTPAATPTEVDPAADEAAK